MKKMILVALAAVLCFSLAACANAADESANELAELAALAKELDDTIGVEQAAEEAAAAASAEASAEPSEAPSEEPSAAPSEETGDLDIFGNGSIDGINAEKIVSVSPAGTEIVCALGGEDRLIGRDEYSNYPESAQSVEVVGDFNGPDVEKIVSLEPDVVLMADKLQQDAIDRLTEMDIPVLMVNATKLEDIPYSYELIGKLLGAEEEAQALADELSAAIAEAEGAQPATPQTVYYAMTYGDAGNWTSGPGSFIYSMIEIAGGKPVPDDPSLPSWVEYPVEDLAAADPEVILVDSSMGSGGDLSGVPGYGDLSAVQNGNVHEINADIFTRPGPRIVEAIRTLSDILNG